MRVSVEKIWSKRDKLKIAKASESSGLNSYYDTREEKLNDIVENKQSLLKYIK